MARDCVTHHMCDCTAERIAELAGENLNLASRLQALENAIRVSNELVEATEGVTLSYFTRSADAKVADLIESVVEKRDTPKADQWTPEEIEAAKARNIPPYEFGQVEKREIETPNDVGTNYLLHGFTTCRARTPDGAKCSMIHGHAGKHLDVYGAEFE